MSFVDAKGLKTLDQVREWVASSQFQECETVTVHNKPFIFKFMYRNRPEKLQPLIDDENIIGDDEMSVILEAVSQSRSIRHVSFSRLNISHKSAGGFNDMLTNKADTLVSLCVESCFGLTKGIYRDNDGRSVLNAIIDALPSMACLEKLELQDFMYDRSGFKTGKREVEFRNIIKHFYNRGEMNYSKAIEYQLSHNRKREKKRNQILQKLADYLASPKSQRLRVLHLKSMSIKNQGVDILARGLRKNNTLRVLDLDFNDMSVTGVVALLNSIKKNMHTQLDYLSFNYCNFIEYDVYYYDSDDIDYLELLEDETYNFLISNRTVRELNFNNTLRKFHPGSKNGMTNKDYMQIKYYYEQIDHEQWRSFFLARARSRSFQKINKRTVRGITSELCRKIENQDRCRSDWY